MEENQINAKKRNFFKLVATDVMMKQIKEIAEKRGKTMSDVIRHAVEKFYYGDFRKEEYGYMAGAGGSTPSVVRKPGRKQSLDDIMSAFKMMNNDDKTKFLYEWEYVTPSMDESARYYFVDNEVNKDDPLLRLERKDNSGGGYTPLSEQIPYIRKAVKEKIARERLLNKE